MIPLKKIPFIHFLACRDNPDEVIEIMATEYHLTEPRYSYQGKELLASRGLTYLVPKSSPLKVHF